MRSELEREFYKVFEISPATVQEYGATYFWDTIEIDGERYTPIDDHKLLEMICILSQSYPLNYEGWSFNTAQDLKETILEDCIETAKRLSLSSVFANKIQQLFMEDNQ